MGESAPGDYGLYGEPTVDISESENNSRNRPDEGHGLGGREKDATSSAGGDTTPLKGKIGNHDGWVEENIRHQAQEAIRARRRWEKKEEIRKQFLDPRGTSTRKTERRTESEGNSPSELAREEE